MWLLRVLAGVGHVSMNDWCTCSLQPRCATRRTGPYGASAFIAEGSGEKGTSSADGCSDEQAPDPRCRTRLCQNAILLRAALHVKPSARCSIPSGTRWQDRVD